MTLGAIGTGTVIAVTIRAIDDFSNTLNKANSSFSAFGSMMGKLAIGTIAAVGTAMVGVGVASVKLAGEFEQTQVAFTTMLGSAEEANKMLTELSNFAKKTPFTIQGVEKSARQLMAVGFEAEDVIPTLKSVGDVAAGLGLGEEGLQRLILNLGQVQTQGKLTGRELRDFAVAGVPILAELANQLGVTEAQVTDMISKGEVSTEMVLTAFKNMTSEGGRFGNLMEKQALTFEGMVSNLKDTITLMGRDIGAALLPPLKDMIDIFANQILPAITPLIPVFVQFATTIIQGLIPYLPQLVEGGKRLFDIFIRIFTALQPLIPPLMDLAFVIFNTLLSAIEPLIPTIEVLATALAPLFEALSTIITALNPLIKLVMEIIAVFIELGVGNITAILIPALQMLTPYLEFLIGIFTKIVEVVKVVVEWIANLVEKVRDFFASGFEKIGNFVGGVFSGGSKGTTTKVGDAIVKPDGSIIQTDPKDYLIATKTPETLFNQEYGNSVVININGNNIYGTDPDDIAEALQTKLLRRLSLGN
jgi:tape measure domain-containing protein